MTITTCSCCGLPLDIKSQEPTTLTRNGRTLHIPGLSIITCFNLECSLYSLTFTDKSYPADPAAYLAANNVADVVARAKFRSNNEQAN